MKNEALDDVNRSGRTDISREYLLDRNAFTVVIPVLNEEEAIGQVIEDVKSEGYQNILVVDGFSKDSTVSIASKAGVEVFYQRGLGKTGAIRTAINRVKTPHFVVMDGDYTYDAKDIKNFLPHMLMHNEVIGMRTVGRENIPVLNRFGNWVINSAFNLFFGTELVDVCSGMYVLKTEFAKQLSLRTKGFDVEIEIAAHAAASGSVAQVPINYGPRIGQQKLRPWKDGVSIMMTILSMVRAYNPLFFYSALLSLMMLPALLVLSWLLLGGGQAVWHPDLAFLGLLVILACTASMLVGTMALLFKRMEHRILDRIRVE